MKKKDLDMLVGINLRKLRVERNFTQEQLAELLEVNSTTIPHWEQGVKGIGKIVLLKLCTFFDVKPSVFYADEKTPHIINSQEQKILYKVREAERLGVHDHIEQYCDFIVEQAKKKYRGGCKKGPYPSEPAPAKANGKTSATRKTG